MMVPSSVCSTSESMSTRWMTCSMSTRSMILWTSTRSMMASTSTRATILSTSTRSTIFSTSTRSTRPSTSTLDDDGVDVHPGQQGIHVDLGDDGVDVDGVEHQVDHPLGDRLDQLLHAAGPRHRAHGAPRRRVGSMPPASHRPAPESGTPDRRPTSPAAQPSGGLQNLEGPVGMHVHPHLALDDLEHPQVGPDHEGRTLGGRQLGEPATHPELGGHRAVGVGQQRVVELVLVRELLLLRDVVGADAHPLGTHRLELRLHVPEVAALDGAPRRHGRRVEEQHHGSGGGELAQAPRDAVLVGKFEVGCQIAGVHGARLAVPGRRRTAASAGASGNRDGPVCSCARIAASDHG